MVGLGCLGCLASAKERAVGYRDSDVTLEGRRYPGGETYPSWREIEEMITAMPAGTKLSYHLNETQDWKYLGENFLHFEVST